MLDFGFELNLQGSDTIHVHVMRSFVTDPARLEPGKLTQIHMRRGTIGVAMWRFGADDHPSHWGDDIAKSIDHITAADEINVHMRDSGKVLHFTEAAFIDWFVEHFPNGLAAFVRLADKHDRSIREEEQRRRHDLAARQASYATLLTNADFQDVWRETYQLWFYLKRDLLRFRKLLEGKGIYHGTVQYVIQSIALRLWQACEKGRKRGRPRRIVELRDIVAKAIKGQWMDNKSSVLFLEKLRGELNDIIKTATKTRSSRAKIAHPDYQPTMITLDMAEQIESLVGKKDGGLEPNLHRILDLMDREFKDSSLANVVLGATEDLESQQYRQDIIEGTLELLRRIVGEDGCWSVKSDDLANALLDLVPEDQQQDGDRNTVHELQSMFWYDALKSQRAEEEEDSTAPSRTEEE